MPTLLSPIGTVAARPAELSGCFQSFSETTLPNIIRTQSEDNTTIQVRRRATHPTRTADATMVLKQDEVQHFKKWFEANCMGGALPTRVIHPDGSEQVWRFASEPVYAWQQGAGQGKHYCQITIKLEQMPNWMP